MGEGEKLILLIKYLSAIAPGSGSIEFSSLPPHFFSSFAYLIFISHSKVGRRMPGEVLSYDEPVSIDTPKKKV